MSATTPAALDAEDALPEALCRQPGIAGQGASATGTRRAIPSAALLAGATAVEIEHLGQIYRLQTTRAGKLILTK